MVKANFDWAAYLSKRKEGVGEIDRESREFPILAINSPATTKTKVELPGDCISLYQAMVVLIEDVFETKYKITGSEYARQGKGSPFNDLFPELGWPPSEEYRKKIAGLNGYSDKFHVESPYDCVFNPGVWNADVEGYFHKILDARKPQIIMACTLSPSHPFALEIANIVHKQLPESVVIFGGAHQDETLRYITKDEIRVSECNTLKILLDKEYGRLVDFVVSGDGEYALSYLCKKASECMDIDTKIIDKELLFEHISHNKNEIGELPGKTCIGFIDDKNEIVTAPTSQKKIDLLELPPIYRFFPLKTRFHVFQNPDGKNKLTAHFITAKGCPHTCLFCSESNRVMGMNGYIQEENVKNIVDRVEEYAAYGAQALFFDDSVFFQGNKKSIMKFCELLSEKIENARQKKNGAGVPEAVKNIAQLEWGAQFTVEDLHNNRSKIAAPDMLNAMRKAGCTYVYFGIESLHDLPMKSIQKFRGRDIYGTAEQWFRKVDDVLTLCKEAGIRAGASFLFGLPGETEETVDFTITKARDLISQGKLHIVSPNLTTYHPGTELAWMHGMESKLDYVTIPEMSEPYDSFEEADPHHLSILLNKSMIRRIKERTEKEWQVLNKNWMKNFKIEA